WCSHRSQRQYPPVRRPAKWVLNRLANYLSTSKIPIHSGSAPSAAKSRPSTSASSPISSASRRPSRSPCTATNTPVVYLPIDYLPRKGKSKIVPWDAASFLVLILRTAMLFRPLRVFLPIVLLCLIYGVVKMSIDLTHQPNISASALLAFVSALQILLIGMVGDEIATRLGLHEPGRP
ncbi:MAG: hypothetical protein QM757_34625, partial [Paludibaculum sp.]